MTYLAKLKRDWNYEGNVPRCDICTHYRPAKLYLIDSLPRLSDPTCNHGGFACRPNAVCDKWVGKDGTKLEPVVVITATATENKDRVNCTACGKRVKLVGLADHYRTVHPSTPMQP